MSKERKVIDLAGYMTCVLWPFYICFVVWPLLTPIKASPWFILAPIYLLAVLGGLVGIAIFSHRVVKVIYD